MSKENRQELTSFRTASAQASGQRSPDLSASSSSGAFRFWPFSSKRADPNTRATVGQTSSAPPETVSSSSKQVTAGSVTVSSKAAPTAPTSAASSSTKTAVPVGKDANTPIFKVLAASGAATPPASGTPKSAVSSHSANPSQQPALQPAAPSAASSVSSLAQTNPVLNQKKSSSKLDTASVKAHRRNLSADLISTDLSRQLARTVSNENVSAGMLARELSSPMDDDDLFPDRPDDNDTLNTVLRRISKMSAGSANIGSSELRQFWMPDETATNCYACAISFNTFRRKHHCRICGQIFCSKCCRSVIPGALLGQKYDLRCCLDCGRIVHEFMDGSHNDAQKTLRIQEFDRRGGGMEAVTSPTAVRTTSRTQPLPALPVEAMSTAEYRKILQRAIAEGSLEIADHRDRMKTYSQCFVASELVDWLLSEGFTKKRLLATTMAQAMLNAKLIVNVHPEEHAFKDEYGLYRMTEAVFADNETQHAHDEDKLDEAAPDWFQEISATTNLDAEAEEDILQTSYTSNKTGASRLDSDSSAAHYRSSDTPPEGFEGRRRSHSAHHNRTPSPTSPAAPTTPGDTIANVPAFPFGAVPSTTEKRRVRKAKHVPSFDKPGVTKQSSVESKASDVNDTTLAQRRLDTAAKDFMDQLATQQVNEDELDSAWKDSVLIPFSRRVVDKVHPCVRRGDKMDIRSYIKVKTVPGGQPADSKYYSGIAFSKNVVHKHMRNDIKNPKILILGYPVEFQREKSKLVSIDNYAKLEASALSHAVSKICSFKPDIVVVGHTVSRIAQDLLREAGVTLMINVKRNVLNFLARLTDAMVVEEPEMLAFDPKLGTCARFFVQVFVQPDGTRKAISFFEGCNPTLGCTIVLRGGSKEELKKVKKNLLEECFYAHGLRLEKHLLHDEFATVAQLPSKAIGRKLATLATTTESTDDKLIDLDWLSSPSRLYRSHSDTDLDQNSLVPASSTAMKNDVEFIRTWEVANDPEADRFLQVLSRLVLSTSPHVKYQLPYLLTKAGAACKFRDLLSRSIMWSPRLQVPLKMQSSSKLTENHSGPDCMSRAAHQNIQVLFSSWRENSIQPCISPRTITMELFGNNDVTLGNFLEHYCFPSEYKCPDEMCDGTMLQHTRYFSHGNGRVVVTVEKLTAPQPHPNPSDPRGLLMWSWCRHCELMTPFMPMSQQTWEMSFGKYLELSYYGGSIIARANICPHSLHHDHVRYFAKKEYLVCFEYEVLSLFELVFPVRTIHPNMRPMTRARGLSLFEEAKSRYGQVFDQLSLTQEACKREISDALQLGQVLNKMLEYKQLLSNELYAMHEAATTTDESDRGAGDLIALDRCLSLLDRSARFDHLLGEVVSFWNTNIQDLLASNAKRGKKGNTNTSNSTSMEKISEESSVDQAKVHRSVSFVVPSQRQSLPTSPSVDEFTPILNMTSEDSSRRVSSSADDEFSVVTLNDNEDAQVPILKPELPTSVQVSAPAKTAKRPITTAASSTSNQSQYLLPWPFDDIEHRTLPWGRLGLSVYENEYSSIIAYTLASNDYAEFIANCKSKPPVLPTVSPARMDPSSDDALLSGSEHFKYQFSDKYTTFYCSVFFAEKFRAMRAKYQINDSEDDFIRSLARCAKWEATGGKSGSDFRKTMDDRFILKQMNRAEAQSFVEFAPPYIQYLTNAAENGCPTVLAKILGVYRIGFKNSKSGRTLKQDVLVMENLFVGRSGLQVFDLKGSMRNRFVQTTGRGDVLLDENFLEFIAANPLYMRQHTKIVFDQAVKNDTAFLQRSQVMDYSLLLGIDEFRRELVVGIIDYIRTFTWDKRLEMYVKSSGILGGSGNLPTVVSPKIYRSRFLEAMERYFLRVPDPWNRTSVITLNCMARNNDNRKCNCALSSS